MRPFRFHPKANCFEEEPTSALSRCPVCFYAAASHSSIVKVLFTANDSLLEPLASPPVSSAPLEINTVVFARQEAISQCSESRLARITRRATGRRSLDAGRLRCPSCSCSDARSRACVTPVCKVLGVSFSRLRSRSTGSEAGKARILANPGNGSSADAFCDLRAALVASVSRAVIAAANMSMPQPHGRVKGHSVRFRPVRPKVPLRACYGQVLCVRSRPLMAGDRPRRSASGTPRPDRTLAHAC